MREPAESVDIVTTSDEQIQTFRRHRKILLSFSRELLLMNDVAAVANRACDAATELAGVRFARILLLDPTDKNFKPAGHSGWDTSDPASLVQDGDMDSEAGYTYRVDKPVIITNTRDEARFKLPPVYQDLGIVTGVNLPMTDSDEVIGVASAQHDQPHSWTDEECEALEFLANITATAIRHSRERQRADQLTEEQARAAHELQIKSAALDATVDMVVITDLYGKVEYVNPAFEKGTGFTGREVIGTKFDFLKSKAATPDIYHDIWDALFAGQTWKGVVVNNHKDGTDYLEEQTITPITGEDGQVHHFIAFKRKIDLGRVQSRA